MSSETSTPTPSWIDFEASKPPSSGLYLIHAPSADPKKPLIMSAWYEKDDGPPRWSLVPYWATAITHWMPLPGPPRRPRRRTKEKATS
jgi:hypothetical protein